MIEKNKKLNRKTRWFIIAGVFALLALIALMIFIIWPPQNTVYLKPTYLPQGIAIKDSYLNEAPSLDPPTTYAAIYVTTDPSMEIAAYRSDDGTIQQLNCSQQVQDQTCMRKVTQHGVVYYVFDSLNSALNTHSIKVKAIENTNVLEIDVEPPLTTSLNENYDWSQTLDSLKLIDHSSLPVHQVHYEGG